MTDVFIRAADIVLSHEGGYVNDPNDAGGETKFGIARRYHPTVDIASLTFEQAREIYRREYWVKQGLDRLPPPLALVTLDAVIHGGPAVIWLQNAVGARADGALGPRTIASAQAAVAKDGTGSVVGDILAQRLVYLATRPGWRFYALGWSRRMFTLYDAALAFEAA